MEFKGSRTEANLMAAFSGESMARNKYDFYAKVARSEGLIQVAEIFEETARNEHYHAKLWYLSLIHISQTAPFFSPKIFREFFKPYYQELVAYAHELGMHFWLHCCGNILAFLPDLIEIGVDVLHPIQKYTMDEREVAQKYGCLLYTSILRVHAAKVRHAPNLDFSAIARAAAGASGAELANIVNEAALRAVRQGRSEVIQSDM